jgi:hypothetical protein
MPRAGADQTSPQLGQRPVNVTADMVRGFHQAPPKSCKGWNTDQLGQGRSLDRLPYGKSVDQLGQGWSLDRLVLRMSVDLLDQGWSLDPLREGWSLDRVDQEGSLDRSDQGGSLDRSMVQTKSSQTLVRVEQEALGSVLLYSQPSSVPVNNEYPAKGGAWPVWSTRRAAPPSQPVVVLSALS